MVRQLARNQGFVPDFWHMGCVCGGVWLGTLHPGVCCHQVVHIRANATEYVHTPENVAFSDISLFLPIFDHFGRFLVYFSVFCSKIRSRGAKTLLCRQKKWVSSLFSHSWSTKMAILEVSVGGGTKLWSAKSRFCRKKV